MGELFLGLTLSIGLGYDMEDDFQHQDKDLKGIIQIEDKDGRYGFWHSSRLSDGLRGNPDDQNIFYIKVKIR